MQNLSFKDDRNILISEISTYLKLSRNQIKSLSKMLNVGHPSMSHGKESIKFDKNDVDIIIKYLEKHEQTFLNEIKAFDRSQFLKTKNWGEYSSPQVAKRINSSVYFVNRVADYFEIGQKIKTSKTERFRFSEENIIEIQKILESIPNKSAFFRDITCRRTYGDSYQDLFLSRQRETVLEKYGVSNVFQADWCKEKIKEFNRSHYGVDYYTQTKEYLEKKENTCLRKYGGLSPTCSPEILEKIQNTVNERYGNPIYFRTQDWKEKAAAAWHEHYGIDISNPYQAAEVKEHIKDIIKDRYNVDHVMHSDMVIQKIKQRWKEKSSKELEDIARKRRSKWMTNLDKSFDSLYELYVYCYLKYNHINFEEKKAIPYRDSSGVLHSYICDFYLIDKKLFVETKCPFMLTPDGKLRDIFTAGLSPQKLEERNKIADAKLECMKRNGVLLVTDMSDLSEVWLKNKEIDIQDIQFYKDWFERNCPEVKYWKKKPLN